VKTVFKVLIANLALVMLAALGLRAQSAQARTAAAVPRVAGSRIVYETPVPTIAPGNVPVYSKYGKVFEVGTGNLVNIPSLAPNSTLVITAAHLVGGKNPRVQIAKKNIDVIGMLVDNDLDIAILEIPLQQKVALEYQTDSERLILAPALEQAMQQNTAPFVIMGANSRDKLQGRSGIRLAFFINSWAENGIEDYINGMGTEDILFDSIGLSYDRKRYNVRARVTGGTSGSVAFRPDGEPVVEGIITQSNYFLSETLLTRSASVIKLLKKYGDGERGSVSDTVWAMRNGLTYRKFAGGWTEVNFANVHTGNGIFGDPGKNVWRAKRPIEVLKHYGISPGLIYAGKTVIGIYARSKNNVGRDLLLAPDPMSLEFMREESDSYNFTLIDSDYPNLISLALGRYGILGPSPFKCKSGAPDNLLKETLQPSRGRNFTGSKHSVAFDGRNVTVKVRTYSKSWTRKSQPDPSDTIEFTLDNHGALKGGPTSAFLPVIEVQSRKTGEIYLVDVRKLLYDDLSQIILPANLPSNHSAAQEVNRQLNLLAIRVRNLNSGIEFGYTFVR
jgi:hypothetical protein